MVEDKLPNDIEVLPRFGDLALLGGMVTLDFLENFDYKTLCLVQNPGLK